ncbi:hypothetical protein BDZ89DRAFT_1130522 [Hymenopellis radicata]|nr:hypothetical protein BDZ89DRAFT_1130522 [Hymenopellis radicata]
MDAPFQSQLLALFEALQHQQLVTYFEISGTALYVFDYLLTLEQEVELIWGSRWTLTKLLYLFTRYSPFIDVGLFLSHQVTPNMSGKTCLLIFKVNNWMSTAGMVLAEVILTLRTWAVWNRPRFLTVSMLTLFSASVITSFLVMGIFLSSLQFMLLLMVVKAYQQFRQAREIGSSQVLHVILKDGIMYYIYLSVLNITNVIVISSLAPDLLGLLVLLERVIHAMLACRVVTNIRAQMKKQFILGSTGTIGDLGTSVGMITFAAHDSIDSLE